VDVKEAGRKGGRAKWATVKSKRKRSEIMRKVRRGEKHAKPVEEQAGAAPRQAEKVNRRNRL
jgi:hypothetical protein